MLEYRSENANKRSRTPKKKIETEKTVASAESGSDATSVSNCRVAAFYCSFELLRRAQCSRHFGASFVSLLARARIHSPLSALSSHSLDLERSNSDIPSI